MTRRAILAALFLLFQPLHVRVWAQTGFFRVEDLRPGMKGVGRTCYLGSSPEEFQVEILGVMRHISPDGDAVLARLTGGPLAQTGVFEGMSGSPVFIDGKLLGAVAFSFPFAKEAIGGITPITQMVDAFSDTAGPGPVTNRTVLKKSVLWKHLLPEAEGIGPARGFEVTSLDARLQPLLEPFAGSSLLPIATPLNLAGFGPATLRLFAPQFRALGLSLIQGAGAAASQARSRTGQQPPPDNSPLGPGSNLVIPLVHGDYEVSAGGTVTWVDGKRLYAFGHPLFNLGFSQLPMYKGRVLAVFPSLQSSFKILETTDPIGTLRQDRSSGVFGELGEKPRMIPMRVRMSTSRGPKKTWNFDVAEDRLLTPLLLNLTIFESVNSSERAMGIATIGIKGKISLKGEQPIEIENRFSSESSSAANAAMSIAAPVYFLMASGFKSLQFEQIEIDITSVEADRSATLDSIRIDRAEVAAGQSFSLTVEYQKSDGDLVRETYPVKIPAAITPGPVSVLVADGATVMQMDAREEGDELIPKSLTQVIKFMNNLRRNDRLYLRVFRQEAGAVIDGEGLPGLPPSILSILRSERSTGSISPIQTLPLFEYEFPPSDYVVSGAKMLNLVIKP
jgi:hypothetical protein